MIIFECDYAEGAHPRIMEQLAATNMEQTPGYGEDVHSDNARRLIKQACGATHSDIHLLVGGTQTNAIVIAAMLRTHQGVICAHTGHVNVHETGAIEAGGHKVLPLPSDNGKLTATQIEQCHRDHWSDVTREHMVQPKAVYLSFPTENGTLYTKAELESIAETCHRCGLWLYVDGARMGYGLMAQGNDVTLNDFVRLTDVFYIGGTKVGALFGEAVVINNDQFKNDFRYIVKQHGGLLAKGRLLGIQFETLFSNRLYFNIAAHADCMAMRLHEAFERRGCHFLYNSVTNQQFPIIENTLLERLQRQFVFSYWCAVDAAHTAVRVCTSWATTEPNVQALIDALA